MNPVAAGRTPNGRNVYREQYLSSLMLDISNQNKTLNAAKLQKSTGSSGAEPGDNRTVTEKYADTDRLKVEVRQLLKEITDPQAAQDIVYELTTEELNFLAGQIPFIIADLKPKFRLGVPAEIFIVYLRKLMRKFVETEGVEYGLQEIGGGGGPGGGMPPPTLNNMPPPPGAPGGLGGASGGAPGLDGVLASIPLENLSATAASVLRRTEQQLGRIAVIYPTVEDQQIVNRCPNPYIRSAYYEAFQEFADNYPTAEQIGQMVESIETAKMVGGKQLMIRTLEPVVDVIQNIDKEPLLRMKDIVAAAREETDMVQRQSEMDRVQEYDEVDAGELEDYFKQIQSAPSNPLQDVFNVDASGEDIPEDISSLTMSERLRRLEDAMSFGDMSSLTISERLEQLEDASGSSGDTRSLSPLERIQQLESDIESDEVSALEQETAQSSVLLPKAREGDIAVLSSLEYNTLPTRDMKVLYIEMIMKAFESIGGLGEISALANEANDANDVSIGWLFLTCFKVDGVTVDPTATEQELGSIYNFLLNEQTIIDLVPGDALIRDEDIPEEMPQAFVEQVSPEKAGPLPALMSREELAASKKGASPSAAPIFDLSDPRAAPKADVTPVRPVGNGLRGGRIGDAFRKAYSKTANVVSSAAKDLYGMDLNQVRELPFTTTPQEVVSYVNQSQGGAISRSCGKNCGCSKCKKMALGKMKSGKGKNILIGRGLISTPSVKVSPSNIDFTQGIKAEPAYVPFGKHLINKWRLNDDVVMIRTPKGGAITSIPTQRVSRNLGKVLKTFVGGKLPDFESLNSLADEDKNILSKIVKTSKLNYSVPNPNKSKQEQEDMEFEILRGQIASGQDNKDALKKFKLLLVKMMNSGRIPKGQGFEILTELAVLGH